jgi:hypothetical protein
MLPFLQHNEVSGSSELRFFRATSPCHQDPCILKKEMKLIHYETTRILVKLIDDNNISKTLYLVSRPLKKLHCSKNDRFAQ